LRTGLLGLALGSSDVLNDPGDKRLVMQQFVLHLLAVGSGIGADRAQNLLLAVPIHDRLARSAGVGGQFVNQRAILRGHKSVESSLPGFTVLLGCVLKALVQPFHTSFLPKGVRNLLLLLKHEVRVTLRVYELVRGFWRLGLRGALGFLLATLELLQRLPQLISFLFSPLGALTHA